jgi:hypothetical protein
MPPLQPLARQRLRANRSPRRRAWIRLRLILPRNNQRFQIVKKIKSRFERFPAARRQK